MRAALPVFLLLIGSLHPAWADEQQTVYGKTLAEWMRVFRDQHSSRADRESALWALACFGPDARTAAPDLIEEVRQGPLDGGAVETLVQIGAGTEATVPYLIDRFLKAGCQHLTGTGTFLFSSWASDNLVRVGGPAVPALLDVLKGPDQDMRVCTAEALGEIGPAAQAAVPALIHAIEHPEADRRAQILVRYAVKALGRIGPEAKAAVPALTALIGGKEGDHLDFNVTIALDKIGAPPVRTLLDRFLREDNRSAAGLLAQLGPKAREAAPKLRNALTDKRPQHRLAAAVALAHIEPTAQDAVPVLIEALKHWGDEAFDNMDLPTAFAQLGPQARAALPELIGIAKAGNADEQILKALVQVDPEGKECVPALIAALQTDEPEVVHIAANCLGLLGPRAEKAIPALTATMTRDFAKFETNDLTGIDPQVAAAHALRRIGPRATSALPALIKALKYRRIVHRRLLAEEEGDCLAAEAAAQVLGSFRADAKAAVPALIEAAQTREKDHANSPVREAAILALGQIGPDAKAAIPTLRNLMKEDGEDSPYLPELIATLYQLAPDGKELAEGWLARQKIDFRHEFGSSLEGRALVLGVMGRPSLETDRLTRRYLASMDSMLDFHDRRDLQVEALEWWFQELGRLGRAGRAAVPSLNEYRKAPDPWIRLWATEALERITAPVPQ